MELGVCLPRRIVRPMRYCVSRFGRGGGGADQAVELCPLTSFPLQRHVLPASYAPMPKQSAPMTGKAKLSSCLEILKEGG